MSTPIPTPFKTEGRTCFGINFYLTEEEAQSAHKAVRERGDTYNGGFYDGMPCGRDTSFDRTEDGRQLFAVTTY